MICYGASRGCFRLEFEGFVTSERSKCLIHLLHLHVVHDKACCALS